jgi:hypothetical protein
MSAATASSISEEGSGKAVSVPGQRDGAADPIAAPTRAVYQTSDRREFSSFFDALISAVADEPEASSWVALQSRDGGEELAGGAVGEGVERRAGFELEEGRGIALLRRVGIVRAGAGAEPRDEEIDDARRDLLAQLDPLQAQALEADLFFGEDEPIEAPRQARFVERL